MFLSPVSRYGHYPGDSVLISEQYHYRLRPAALPLARLQLRAVAARRAVPAMMASAGNSGETRAAICVNYGAVWVHRRDPIDMKAHGLNPRIRKSPYFASCLKYGATEFHPFNGMWMPVGYDTPANEYWNTIERAGLWDVAVQRCEAASWALPGIGR